MGEKRMDRLARFPRALAKQYAVVLTLLPAGSFLLSSHRHRRWAWDEFSGLTLAGIAVAVSFTLWLSTHFRKRAIAEAQAKGMTPKDATAAGLFTGLGLGCFLPVYGFMVTNSEGWAWGGLFYGVYVLHGAYLLFRLRRYTATLANAG